MCQEPKTVVSFTVSETDTHVTTTLSIEKKDLDDLDTFLARVNLMFVRTLHGAQIYQEKLASNHATPQAEHPEAPSALV